MMRKSQAFSLHFFSIYQLTTTLIYTIDQKFQAIDQRNKSSKVGSLTGVIAILAITSKHSNNAAAIAINALQFTNLSRRKDSKIEEMGYLKIS